MQGGSGPHETIVGSDGKYVYLGGVNTPYLEVGSTTTERIVRKIGPLYRPGVRPFTINATQTLAFTTSWNFLGFQVSSIKTGKVLYSVSPPGFRFDAAAFGSIPDHGISLSPDGRQLYLIDTPNGMHVFDVSGLPRAAPDVADIARTSAVRRRQLAATHPRRPLCLRRTFGRRDRYRQPQDRLHLPFTAAPSSSRSTGATDAR
jgi:hypothetical protein